VSLDINTPRGQESVHEELEMLDIMKAVHKKYQFIQTPITKAALIDGMVIMDGKLVAIYESKCRRNTLKEFKNDFSSEWMVSFHKLQAGSQLAKALCVPFYGFLYLVPDKMVARIRITDEKGNFLPSILIGRKQTSKCCNGGTMMDTCGFISLDSAVYITKEDSQ
jgi:hypothetical protein